MVAQQLYTLWVGGSNPSSPTIFEYFSTSCDKENKTRYMKRLMRCCAVIWTLTAMLPARADVMVYQFRTTSRLIGQGTEAAGRSRGYLVWDLNGNHFTWVAYGSSQGVKCYKVTTGDPLVVNVAGFAGRSLTTFSAAGGGEERYFQDFNQGQNVTLRQRSGYTIQLPRIFKGDSRNLVTGASARLTSNTHTAVYWPQRTLAANDAGLTAADVAQDLVTELEAKGYVDSETLSAGPSASGSVTLHTLTGRFNAPLTPPLPPFPLTPEAPTPEGPRIPNSPPLPGGH